jgi:hypothetical protein
MSPALAKDLPGDGITNGAQEAVYFTINADGQNSASVHRSQAGLRA